MTTVTSETNNLAVYVCPACKGKLESAKNALRCGTCKITYPLLDGIPDFLLEDREQSLGLFGRAMMDPVVRI